MKVWWATFLIAISITMASCGEEPHKPEAYTGPAGTTLGVERGNYRDVGDFFRVKVIEFVANEGGGYATCVYRGDNDPNSPTCVFHDGTRDK